MPVPGTNSIKEMISPTSSIADFKRLNNCLLERERSAFEFQYTYECEKKAIDLKL